MSEHLPGGTGFVSSISPGMLSRSVSGLERGLLSPMCGLAKSVAFLLAGSDEPHAFSAGVDITGMHVLRGEPAPTENRYHVGGGGLTRDEALVKALAETVERYVQIVHPLTCGEDIVHARYRKVAESGRTVIDRQRLEPFDQSQYRAGFPFGRITDDDRLGWVPLVGVTQQDGTLAPAQFVLVGYKPDAYGEPWLSPAVTTGTAVHTDPVRAALNALLELIQIDCAMGHWFGNRVAHEIVPDESVAPVIRVMQKMRLRGAYDPAFFWLSSPDMPALSVACVLTQFRRGLPHLAVGLGAGLDLTGAMYRSLIEATGVAHLVKVVLVTQREFRPADPSAIFDLNGNVAWYAGREHATLALQRFRSGALTMQARDVPSIECTTPLNGLRILVRSARSAGIRLYSADLSLPESDTVGLSVARLWSPDLLPLALPSAPPLAHPRFVDYAGAQFDLPHPYP